MAMENEISTLPDNVSSLKHIITTLSKTNAEQFKKQEQQYKDKENLQKKKIEGLEEQLRLLRQKLFGRSSEKIPSDDNQLPLFNETEEEVIKAKEEKETTIPEHTRKKPGRKPLPADLPRTEVIHDLPAEEKICGCGCDLSKIGEEISEKLNIIPARINVIRNIRYKYACKNCEGVEEEEGAVKTAPLPPQLIPKGIATAGLLAHILTSKFVDALPFYRQEKQFARIGVELNRASLSLPIPESNQQEFELFRQQCQAKYTLRNENRFFLTDQVRRCLQTGSYELRLTDVAKQLNIGERSVRRQLNNEGISFRELKNQYIFQQALNLLKNPDLRIEEISETLGYSETSAFTRAFLKWTGVPPGRYRKRSAL